MRIVLALAIAAYLLSAEPLAINKAEIEMESNNLVLHAIARSKARIQRLNAMEGRIVAPECLTWLMFDEEWCGRYR